MSTSVHFNCLCGRQKGTAMAAVQHLPEDTLLCHCNICRYTSGVLCVSYLTLAASPKVETSLATYQSSAKLKRHFCKMCGANIFVHNSDIDEWYLATGLIEMPAGRNHGETIQTTNIVQHEFVSDTLDGGLALCLETIQGRQLKFFAQGPDREPLTLTSGGTPLAQAISGSKGESKPDILQGEEHLHASCHCGGVQFRLSRPNDQSTQLSSPWPDLLVPYHSASPENHEDVKWWLRAGGTKYLAGTCACRSCRLASGFPIQTWAFVPMSNILTLYGRPLSFILGSLKQFNSSPGVYREFCGTCGATVFWHCDERPDLIDVSVGLLRAEEGSRAEKWLEWWTERVSFKEDAVDKALIDALEDGLSKITKG